jgi:shikimate kinase
MHEKVNAMQNFYFITGFMGTGKSTILRKIHSRLVMSNGNSVHSKSFSIMQNPQKEPFHKEYSVDHTHWILEDLDDYIVNKIGCSISDFFANFGEKRFRQIERECLEEIIERVAKTKQKEPLLTLEVVISLGGGCIFSHPCRLEILRLAQESNLVLCCNLSTDFKTIQKRIQNDEVPQRPLASQLQQKYMERKDEWSLLSHNLQMNDIQVLEIQSTDDIDWVFHSVCTNLNLEFDFLKQGFLPKTPNITDGFSKKKPMLEMIW